MEIKNQELRIKNLQTEAPTFRSKSLRDFYSLFHSPLAMALSILVQNDKYGIATHLIFLRRLQILGSLHHNRFISFIDIHLFGFNIVFF